MTPDLAYLARTALMTASLWLPYVVAQSMTNGALKPANYTDPTPRPLPAWGRRADRTYVNAIEAFAPFASLVVVAHLTQEANAMTAFWAAFFFWSRVVHAVVYLLGVPYVRTLAFTAGWVGVVGLGWEIVR